MNYWLIKSEPTAYSWDQLVADKKTNWEGVRNYQARNNLKLMKKGDIACFYHSMDQKSIVGLAKITKEYFDDPSDTTWVAVEVSFYKKIKNPVSLAQIKADQRLTSMALVRSTRLSVQPVTPAEFEVILELSH